MCPVLARIACAAFALAATCQAQFVPAGQPIPKRSSPPVVFVNGYQSGCSGSSDFASNFATADKVLQTVNLSTVYFDNCSAGVVNIETLGQAFGKFLGGLKYDDGSSVTLVDVVSHSMGGLIVRSYLAGKNSATATFAPLVSTGIRKSIFLSSPNFGTKVVTLLGGIGGNVQTDEMAPGSPFLFDLNTWNQGTDDLRGVDALAIAGNAGTGLASGNEQGFDDGLVSITSSSIGFARPGRTKLVPYCHTANSLEYTFNACPNGAPALNQISDPTTVVSKLILSFLTGTPDWQSLGQPIEQNALGSVNGGLLLVAHTPDDQPVAIGSATFATAKLDENGMNTAYSEHLPAKTSSPVTINGVGGVTISSTTTLPAGTTTALTYKSGPQIVRVTPAAAGVFPYSLAPGSFVGNYGAGLATSGPASGTTSGQPYPTQLADVQITVNGTAMPLQYTSAGQVNGIFPDLDPGLYKMTIKNTVGQQTLNVLVEAAVPAIFSQDASGTGAAAALNAVTGVLATPSTPLHAGDYVSLYLTGLGRTNRVSGFDYALQQPTVTVGGKACNVTYAGRNTVYTGLDQINCLIPAGLASGPQTVVVVSGSRTSNTVTLPIQ